MSETLSIVGWDRFQHYKDRDPPWIKLYRDLLTTESWVLGTDLSRLVQVASLLLAARYANKIPMQWKLVRKVASLDCSEKEFLSAVSHLCATKFFEIQSLPDERGELVQPASTVLATCTSETEQSRGRAETEQITRASARPSKRCPQDFQVTADLTAWAERKVPGVDVASETERFRDYEFKNAHSDWPATWREWMRKASERGTNGKPRASSQPRVSALERVRLANSAALDDDPNGSSGGQSLAGYG